MCSLGGNVDDGYYLYNDWNVTLQNGNTEVIETKFWCRGEVFCEDLLHIPEYASVITAVFISLMAFYQFTWDHPVEIIRFTNILFFANGVTSAINHYTASAIFSFLDNATMYLPLFIMVGLVTNKFLAQPRGKLLQCVKDDYYWRFMLRFLVWIIIVTLLVILLFNDWTLEPLFGVFVAIFAVILLFLVAIGIYVERTDAVMRYLKENYCSHDPLSNIPHYVEVANDQARRYFIVGIIVSFICAAIWLISEPICTQSKDGEWLKYVFGHSWWHIGMSYGLSLVILYMCYMECILRGHAVYFIPMRQVLCTCGKFKMRQVSQRQLEEMALDAHRSHKCILFPVLFVSKPNSASSTELEEFFKNERESSNPKSNAIVG